MWRIFEHFLHLASELHRCFPFILQNIGKTENNYRISLFMYLGVCSLILYLQNLCKPRFGYINFLLWVLCFHQFMFISRTSFLSITMAAKLGHSLIFCWLLSSYHFPLQKTVWILFQWNMLSASSWLPFPYC